MSREEEGHKSYQGVWANHRGDCNGKRERHQTKGLRRNPPEVRVTSGQRLCTEIIYIVWQTFVELFQISSRKKSFIATPNVKNKFWSSCETLESPGEMKLMMNFYLSLHNFPELWNLFSRVIWEIVSGVISGNVLLFISLALRKCKKTLKYLKLFWHKIFFHWKHNSCARAL